MKKRFFLRVLSILILCAMACGFAACRRRAVCAAASVCAPLSQVSCRYQDRVVKTADFLLRLQCKNGAIRDFAGADTVNTDSNMEYALIGLGAAYRLTADEKYLVALKKGICWLAAAECMSADEWKGSWWYQYAPAGKHTAYTDDADIQDIRGVDTTSALFVYLLYLEHKLDPDSTLTERFRPNAEAALDFLQRMNLDSDHLSQSCWQKDASGEWNLCACKYSADQGDVYLGFQAAGELFSSEEYFRLAALLRQRTEDAFFSAEQGRYCVSIEDGAQNMQLDSFEPIQAQGFLPWAFGTDAVNADAAGWLSGKMRTDGSISCYEGDPQYAMSTALLGMAENAVSGAQPAAAYEWLHAHLFDSETGGLSDSTLCAEEDCNVAGWCLIALTRMLPFEQPDMYGVTLDDVTAVPVQEVIDALDAMDKKPTVRIVMRPELRAAAYAETLKALHGHAFILLCPCDSSYLPHYRSVQAYTARFKECVKALAPYVDIWETGNEINGEGWTGLSAQEAAQYVYAAWKYLYAAGLTTEITPYAFRPGDQSLDMIPWLEKYIPEQMKKHIDHVLISYYDADNGGMHDDWQTTFDRLKAMFPNAYVGFGECGFPEPHEYDAEFQKQFSAYYGMTAFNDRYEGGYFWWYWQEDLLPRQNNPAG